MQQPRAVPAAEPSSPNKRGRPLKHAKPCRDPATKSSSEPPPRIAHMVDGVAAGRWERREPARVGLGNKVQPEWAGEESPCDNMSDSSFSDDDEEEGSLDSGIIRRSGRHRRIKSTVTHEETKRAIARRRSDTQAVDPSHAGVRGMNKLLATSKSEGHISPASTSVLRLPGVKRARANPTNIAKQKHPGRKRDMRIPPPGGRYQISQSSTMKEMEAQISNLRTSANARQELEERIHQLMKGSKRRNSRLRQGRGGGQDVGGVGLDDTGIARVDGGESTTGEWLASARGAARGRMIAQRAHAEEVLQRKRAIEQERARQVTERSRLVAEQERRLRDGKEKLKRAEALIVIVACAAALSEWTIRFQANIKAKREAEERDAAATKIGRIWRNRRIRHTWAQVRASGPAVQKFVFTMRLKAALAKEAVAKRHKKMAADLLTAVLRSGTCSAFRTRVNHFRAMIVKCQSHITSFRAITKARKKLLVLKWTRETSKLDGKRFHTYCAHLRDMYNFDPLAVDRVLREMRFLAANGQTSSSVRADANVVNSNALNAGQHGTTGKGGAKLPLVVDDVKVTASSCNTEGAGAEVENGRRDTKKPRPPVGLSTAPSTAAPGEGKPIKRAKVKLASGWQNRVVNIQGDVETQAALMSKRGVKHKEISRELRSVLINDLLSHARRVHQEWFWNTVRSARERKKQGRVVNITDIRTALRTPGSPSSFSGEGVPESKMKALGDAEGSDEPEDTNQGMHLMNMTTDDLFARTIIFAERIEGCVAADNTGSGLLSPNELRDIFVVNRHPSQHESGAVKEIKTELQAWAKGRGLPMPAVRRGSSKTALYHVQQLASKHAQTSKVQQVPYFEFMGGVKGGILSEICVPEGQCLAMEAHDR